MVVMEFLVCWSGVNVDGGFFDGIGVNIKVKSVILLRRYHYILQHMKTHADTWD